MLRVEVCCLYRSKLIIEDVGPQVQPRSLELEYKGIRRILRKLQIC